MTPRGNLFQSLGMQSGLFAEFRNVFFSGLGIREPVGKNAEKGHMTRFSER